MSIFQSLIIILVSFSASTIGAICGIGGGVIIKPVLDSLGWMSVSVVSFLSGCTVLSMSCYSVVKSLRSKEKGVDLRTGTPLAIGGAIGGIVGKEIFNYIREASGDLNKVGEIQSICLGIITVLTLVYTVKKAGIRTYRTKSSVVCVIIGLALGVMSSFLGIGGGPINLVVLFFFFSMPTKDAAANSLYIILFSQATSLVSTVVQGHVPEFLPVTLVLMICGGILGGIIGRFINKKISAEVVDKLFIGLMVVIIIINVYNTARFAGVI